MNHQIEMSYLLTIFFTGLKSQCCCLNRSVGKELRGPGWTLYATEDNMPSNKILHYLLRQEQSKRRCMSNSMIMFPDTWLPNASDLNPLDYYVWGIIKREVNQHCHNTIQFFKFTLTSTIGKIDIDYQIRTCHYFWPHVEATIDANGELIKQLW